MNIWPVTAVMSGQSWLGGTKMRLNLTISLILSNDFFYISTIDIYHEYLSFYYS